MSDPPQVAALGHVVIERLLAPGRVARARKRARLELGHGADVVDRHGTQLAVDAGKRVVHAGDGGRQRLFEAQPSALVLLGIGEARVDGQHEGRIARVNGAVRDAPEHARSDGGTKQALARGMPGVLVSEAREARGLKLGAVLLEAIARKHDLPGVVARGPSLDGIGRLHDGLDLKQAHGAVLTHLVEGRVDLAAHGVSHNAHEPAHAVGPHAPGNGVERGHPVERAPQAARESLCRGDADAHARERAGTAPHEHRVHVRHRKAGAAQDVQARGHELLVGMAATQMVAARQQLDALLTQTPDGAGKHVRRRVDGKDDLLGSGFAHGLGPFMWCE